MISSKIFMPKAFQGNHEKTSEINMDEIFGTHGGTGRISPFKIYRLDQGFALDPPKGASPLWKPPK